MTSTIDPTPGGPSPGLDRAAPLAPGLMPRPVPEERPSGDGRADT